AVALAALLPVALSACREVEEASPGGYEPAKVEPLRGSVTPRVTLTAEGARRTGLQTARVTRRGARTAVSYDALIYAEDGATYVYTRPEALSFVRRSVVVDRIAGDRALLLRGPPAGTEVVTVGAAEVYGTELDVAGGH
ncbi:MAG: hypothetical protein QOF29_3578, partial [bacterium]